MNPLIINTNETNVLKQLDALSANADRINIAVAFFSNTQLIKKWNSDKKEITLIVSLRPPTSYYSLKEIQTGLYIDTYFLGEKFHSKIYLFYKNGSPFAALLGSSNFSDGGLIKNTEANIIVEDGKTLKILDNHFIKDLLPDANKLQPSDIDEYKIVYLKYLKRKEATKKDIKKFFKKLRSGKRNRKISPCKEARQYFIFWRIVNEVRDLVKPLSDKHFPHIPYYLVLDHFWHWIKTVWYNQHYINVKPSQQKVLIPKLFKQYIDWQSEGENASYLKWMNQQSKTVFKKYLSPKKINNLTKPQALEIYRTLHSSSMPIQRFSSDDEFARLNNISKIRKAFHYLLYSTDGIDVRIHNLLKNPEYKLHKLAFSGVQEINGWMRPDIFPIRNDKADDAIKILGYNLNEAGK